MAPHQALRAGGDEKLQQQVRQNRAQRTAEHGQDEALSQKLSQDTEPRSAQRHTNRYLVTPFRGPREQQISDICGSQQEYESHCSEQQENQRAIAPHRFIAERLQLPCHPTIRLRVLLSERFAAAPDVIAGLFHGDSWRKPSCDLHESHAAGSSCQGVRGEGQPDGDFRGRARERLAQVPESGRKDTNDGVKVPVQSDWCAQNIGATPKSTLPVRVTENGNLGAMGPCILRGQEASPEHRRCPQHSKQVG